MNGLFIITLLFFQQPQVPTAATGVVSGTVLYSDGTPATEMPLRLLPVEQQPQPRNPFGRLDSTGSFSIQAAPGRYFLRTLSAVPVYYPGVLTEAEARPVVVTAGSLTAGLNFSLPPSASGVRIRGRVSVPPNYPTPAPLRVEISRQGLTAPIAADGSFEFTHITAGSYPLMVAAPGMQPVIVAVADRDVTGVELVVPPLIPVRGAVSVDRNGARPRFSVQFGALLPAGATPSTPPYATTANAMPNGTLSASLPPGQYKLLLSNVPEGYYLKTLSTGSIDLLGSPLRVSATDASIPIAIGLGMSPKVRVSGRVTGSGNSSAASLPEKVTLSAVATTEVVETLVNADVSFDFPQVNPGTYFARVALTPTISSAPSVITIPNRNLENLELPIPSPRDVYGRVAVDGNGPPPKFSLLLVRGSNLPIDAGRSGELPTVSPSALVNLVQSGGSAGGQVLQIDVNALPDGSFKIKLPDGEYRVVMRPAGLGSATAGVPAAYFLRSLTSNSADLMTEPLSVSEKETTQIHPGFGTTASNPWAKVSGRVAGLDRAGGAYRVALESNLTSAIETHVDAEGRFEFPAVLQRTNYTARLVPAIPAASSPRVVVADKDVTDVEISVPPEREMTVRVSMEDNSPPPSFGLSLNATGSSMMVVVRPEPDGTFKAKLPEDERRLTISALPLGYSVKSLTYGSANLLQQPLRISGAAVAEIQVRLAVDPAVSFGSVRGRVTGLEPDNGAVRIVLNGVSTFSTFEAPLNADGSFNFPRIPQGTYMPSLEGAVVAARLATSPIVVTGPDLRGLEIAAPQQTLPAPRAGTDESPTGASASDFPGGGRAAANEAAAVANLRTINTALVTSLSARGGRYGSLQDLMDAQLLDNSFSTTKSGFNFSIVTIGDNYAAAAIPANSSTGRVGYFSGADAVVRYSTFGPLAPEQQGGKPVQ